MDTDASAVTPDIPMKDRACVLTVFVSQSRTKRNTKEVNIRVNQNAICQRAKLYGWRATSSCGSRLSRSVLRFLALPQTRKSTNPPAATATKSQCHEKTC